MKLILMLLTSLVAFGQYLEEQGTLEGIYEARARAILNQILRPNEYSVVVSIELERDKKKLSELENIVELSALPGMPLSGEFPQVPKALNKLHELKSKVSVSIVLLTDLGSDNEQVISDLIYSKLALERGFDEVQIKKITSRAEQPQRNVAQEKNEKENILPDIGWRTWTLLLALGLLGAASIALLVMRKRRSESSISSSGNEKRELLTNSPSNQEGESQESSDVSNSNPELSEAEERMIVLMPLDVIREQTVKLCTLYPVAMSEALAEHVSKESPAQVALFMEFLGWDVGKKLFAYVTPGVWSLVGYSLKELTNQAKTEDFESSIRAVFKTILRRYLVQEYGMDRTNPFAKYLGLSNEELSSLVNLARPETLAVMCVYSSAEAQAHVLNLLDADKRADVLAKISSISTIDNDVLSSAVKDMEEWLIKVKQQQSVLVPGVKIASQALRGLDAEAEEILLSEIRSQFPEQYRLIRQQILLLDDLTRVPEAVVTEVLEEFEAVELAAAFSDADDRTRRFLLTCVPEKKAMILEYEWANNQSGHSGRSRAQVLNLRRSLLVKIEQLLKSRGVWSSIFKPDSRMAS